MPKIQPPARQRPQWEGTFCDLEMDSTETVKRVGLVLTDVLERAASMDALIEAAQDKWITEHIATMSDEVSDHSAADLPREAAAEERSSEAAAEKPSAETVCLNFGIRGKTSAQSSLWFAAVAPFLSCCSCQAAALCVEAVGTLLQSGSEVGTQHHVPHVRARSNVLLQYCEPLTERGFERSLIG